MRGDPAAKSLAVVRRLPVKSLLKSALICMPVTASFSKKCDRKFILGVVVREVFSSCSKLCMCSCVIGVQLMSIIFSSIFQV